MLIIEGSTGGRVQAVRVLNHCVICLVKLNGSGRNEDGVPKYRRRRNVTQRMEVLADYMVHGKPIPDSELVEFSVDKLNKVWRHIVDKAGVSAIMFPRTPPICENCGRMFEHASKLLNQLEGVTNNIKDTLERCGKYGDHAEERFFSFLGELKLAKVEDGSRRATLNFLEKIGHGEVKEEEYQSWFPKNDNGEVETDIVHTTSTIPTTPAPNLEENPTPRSSQSSAMSDDPEDMEEKVKAEGVSSVLETVETQMDCKTSEIQTCNEESSHVSETDSANEAESDMEVDEVPIHSEDAAVTIPDPLILTADILATKVVKPRRSRRRGEGPRSKTTCDFCNQNVPLKQLESHVRSHVGDYVVKCLNPSCKHVFASLQTLNGHIKKVQCKKFSSRLIISCEVCNTKFQSLFNLRNHLNITHETGTKALDCPVTECSKKFVHRQSVQCHIVHAHALGLRFKKLIGAPPSFQKCLDCFKVIHQDRFRLHLESVHNTPSDTIISCQHCPYLFKSKPDLITHLRLHMLNGIPVDCDMCSSETKYVTLASLRKHYFEAHQIGTRFLCEHCSRCFWEAMCLKQHVNKDHSENAKKILAKKTLKCLDCDADELYTEAGLQSHKIRVHGAQPYKCDSCEKTFKSWQKLLNHEKIHKGVVGRKFLCDIPGCDKKYRNIRDLEKHKLSVAHLGKTNAFICGQCGSGFNLDRDLKGHVASVHVTERKFICEECGETFKSNDVLKKHRRIHTGERPFECPVCQQRFRHDVVLARHLRGHQEKGESFKPNGPMKHIRKRVNPK